MASSLFIVGAQRSATTYLVQLLASHPEVEVALPVFPEPKFFLQEQAESRLNEYKKTYFGRKPGATVLCEKSTSYLDSPAAAARIAQAFPEARIIICLRNPIQRAISHYWFSVTNRREDKSIEVLRDEDAQFRSFDGSSTSPFAYLDRGCYVKYIDIYAERFPRAQIQLLVNEFFVGNQSAISELFQWLGIDHHFIPASINETINSNEYGSFNAPESVRTFLQEYYKLPNKQLHEKYGVDISRWSEANSSCILGAP